MEIIEGIGVSRQGTTAIVTLSNPSKRNAFYKEMRRQLTTTLLELSKDHEVRAIVLTGEGSHFCTGADLSRSSGPAPQGPTDVRNNSMDVNRLVQAIAGNTKPIIAAVEGDAYGAGFSMVLLCDTIVVAKNARFGAVFTKIGIMPELGLMYTLPQRVGAGKARQILMMGEPVSGEEAQRIGMSDVMTEPGGALAAALEQAERYAAIAPLSATYTKAAMNRGIGSIEQSLNIELDYIPMLAMSADCKEAMTAFREKRKPTFTGR